MLLVYSSNSAVRPRPRSTFLIFIHTTLVFLSLISVTSGISVPLRLSANPGYQGRANACPTRCVTSGPNPANWTLYRNLEQFTSCQESLFYSFSFFDPVDESDTLHRIRTCTSFGPDWGSLPANTSSLSIQSAGAPDPVNGTYQIGSWPAAPGSSVSSSLATLINQIRQYLSNGFGSVNRPTILFASYGPTSVGLYIGDGLQNQGIADNALAYLQTSIATSNANNSAAVAMQFCEPGQTSDYVFGLIGTGNGTFATVQSALTSWSNAECLTFPLVQNFTSTVPLAKPLHTSSATIMSRGSTSVQDSILAPEPQADGTCATYTIQPNDDCYSIAAGYNITVDDLEDYNNDTWAWVGCTPLYAGEIICLSTGNSPMPATVANAVCGPQVPGTPTPPTGVNISMLNPCPLNACCDVWGQCGTTAEFCTDTGTGAPGTAAAGTNGCISNCGTNIVLSSPPATYRSIGYYEGYNLQRPCLYQDVSQLDTSIYTHIYFAFGILSASYEVQIPNATTLYEFNLFLEILGPLRILSIGGWSFSTDPSTYMIFREGVTSENRLTMATNIANFINDNDLDGVNIDWEYPGAPDIPGIPPASTDDGANYLAFLVILKNLLPDKEVTIAAPASYWYLQGFPIEQMALIVDYIIYMTYDLHGQWDSGNQWSQDGCPTGTCLRTDVNLTETIGALVMITKAGVPSNKVVVGVTSYGRSFAMAEAGCYGPQCTFLGTADDSQAAPGPCTQTAGYIGNAEIEAILANTSRVNENYIDATSNTNILVYDDVQWVGWMSDGIKSYRAALYQDLSMGGTTDWATDLQEYNDPPFTATNWGAFVSDVVLDVDPYQTTNRTGNWTNLTCTSPVIQDQLYLPVSVQWGELDAPNAWSDAINTWFNYDEAHLANSTLYKNHFCASIFNTFHAALGTDCAEMGTEGSCDTLENCAYFEGLGDGTGGSGPAAMLIYNSLVSINQMYTQLYNGIFDAAGGYIDTQLQDFEDTFAPVPPAPSNEWLILLTSLLGLGLTAIAAPVFDGFLGGVIGDATSATIGDITYAALAYGAAIGAGVISPGTPGSWTATSQDSFTATLGSVVYGWANVTANQLYSLFNGSETSVATLGTLIANGNFYQASISGGTTTSGTSSLDVTDFINKAFFGFAIPAVWTVSGTAAFVLDSGYPCSAQNPLTQYMTAETQEDTYVCYNDNLYYLVYPYGTWKECPSTDSAIQIDCVDCDPTSDCVPTYFVAPPGLDQLDSESWGGITLSDLIEGSVNTYVANGNANGGAIANPLSQQTIQDLSNQDVSTPGYIRLPVCSGQIAWASWSNPSQSNASAPNYPCNPLQGVTKCSSYTYEDATTSASPKISDCQTIVSNIQATNGEWTTGIGGQRDIASFGTCNFGVQNSGVTGDVTYYTGSQDIVNIITESIAQFSWEGLVGASGYMECGGDAGSQRVEWGLY